jgi:SET domain-containing protein
LREKSLDYNWLTPKAQMRVTPGKGSGSFAISQISKGEIVASFGGNVINQIELTNYSADRVSRSLQLNSDSYLLSGETPEAGDMINHSCEPNCGIAGTSSVQTLRDIEIGEELTFDYAMSDSSQYDEFSCSCRKEECRGKITGTDWQKENLQTKYKNYFSSYIEKLIKLSHSK